MKKGLVRQAAKDPEFPEVILSAAQNPAFQKAETLDFVQDDRKSRFGEASGDLPVFRDWLKVSGVLVFKGAIDKNKFFVVDVDADGAAPGLGIDQPGGPVFAAAGYRR